MTLYATGKYAAGCCDRCSCVYKYGLLRSEYKNNKRTGLMVCPACYDGSHPLDVPPKIYRDAQQLRNARPRREMRSPNESDVDNNAFQPPNNQTYDVWLRSRT